MNEPQNFEEPCAPDGTPVSSLLHQIAEMQQTILAMKQKFRSIRYRNSDKELKAAEKRLLIDGMCQQGIDA